mmetsp:Transcript_22717/g.27457  ORF Transcript_22717/g.27457 Transcript_22717/m.27457 type:complete len:280 (+) Transcript_22717:473-1312(+)
MVCSLPSIALNSRLLYPAIPPWWWSFHSSGYPCFSYSSFIALKTSPQFPPEYVQLIAAASTCATARCRFLRSSDGSPKCTHRVTDAIRPSLRPHSTSITLDATCLEVGSGWRQVSIRSSAATMQATVSIFRAAHCAIKRPPIEYSVSPTLHSLAALPIATPQSFPRAVYKATSRGVRPNLIRMESSLGPITGPSSVSQAPGSAHFLSAIISALLFGSYQLNSTSSTFERPFISSRMMRVPSIFDVITATLSSPTQRNATPTVVARGTQLRPPEVAQEKP